MIGDQRGKSTRVPLADGAHLPRTLASVHLERDDDGLGGEAVDHVLVQHVPGRIGDPSGRCSSAPEVRRSVVERDDGANLLDIGGYAGE